jgi:formylglycine-generating enzyme required for sulfatase activity
MTDSRSPTPTTAGDRKATFLLRQPRLAQGFREPLRAQDGASAADDPALTMIWIPPGRFWMGSPAEEVDRSGNEGPLHWVQLQGFFISQTPITQAQWREVAQWKPRQGEQWGRELTADPSFFRPNKEIGAKAGLGRKITKGLLSRTRGSQPETSAQDQHPVERVSWEDAMEFCHRLSQRTGRHYTLPSEAQWEYGCRAGTRTPFAFGETLSDELANYNACETYGKGPKGEFRQQTTPVGMFPANAWGLQDMHGNVWEWCLDHWHEGYEGAPEDGSGWFVPGQSKDEGSTREVEVSAGEAGSRLLRGGSWLHDPGYCRSADRGHDRPAYALYAIGFRVVCLPQGPSLNT